jgi:hypothetical protein
VIGITGIFTALGGRIGLFAEPLPAGLGEC